jgi:O-methyltransferase domain
VNAPGHWLTYGRLYDAVISGRPQPTAALGVDLWAYSANHPDERDHFARAMSTISAEASTAVVRHYDVAGCRCIVDVGGSQGALLAALLARAPSATGVLFDLPGVVDGARAALAHGDLADRIEIVGGDFFDAVPSGGDLYLLKSVLHDWDDEHALRILRSVHRASQPGARVAVIEYLLPAEPGPSYVHLMNLLMLVALGGRERASEEYAKLLDEAGFRLERTIPTSGSAYPWSIVEAVRR